MDEIFHLEEANETGSSLGSLGRKSFAAGLKPSLTKHKSVMSRPQLRSKGSVVLKQLDGHGKTDNSFKKLAFLNRSNTAMGDQFNKRYLEPEVYGKSRENFMKQSDNITDESQELSEKEHRVGVTSPLKRVTSQEVFAEEDGGMDIYRLIEKKRHRKTAEARIKAQKDESV